MSHRPQAEPERSAQQSGQTAVPRQGEHTPVPRQAAPRGEPTEPLTQPRRALPDQQMPEQQAAERQAPDRPKRPEPAPERWAAPPFEAQNGFGLTALITGVIGLALFWLPIVNLVFGLLGTVFGLLGFRRVRKGMATNPGQALTGLMCGLLAFVIAVLLLSFGLAEDSMYPMFS
ncbi:hypothetical protein FNH05_14700 [Amycolatopsis rhizosphaerae]|uniref:DUF4190 domain-containing protein n=1 Tax=Amycolatopsis rhizosphaerae TaxID=2053003 RepID=A0A558CRY0_9PSEU|nr:DUF4190 domain-containing protein [Amycolatopsis rhizosphaerae]TVT51519.1 hypothetical protein FNH05_14700 [Amycolatopsis rhizosphaerae]